MNPLAELRRPLPAALGIAAIIGWGFAFYTMSAANRHRMDATSRVELAMAAQRMTNAEMATMRQAAGTLAEITTKATQARAEAEAAAALTLAEAAKLAELRAESEGLATAVAARVAEEATKRAEAAKAMEELNTALARRLGETAQTEATLRLAQEAAAAVRKETEALRQQAEEAATKLATTTDLLRLRQAEVTEAETRLRVTMAAQEAAKAELARLLPAEQAKPAAQ